ncbi:MAG: hypothetical protein RMM31_03080 [Anaerolineae bacterium]|nr:hypothetical protein [Thermoflexales bacterium]MDW8395207.1 hypothetical protein [Anaerolineae bacterium]
MTPEAAPASTEVTLLTLRAPRRTLVDRLAAWVSRLTHPPIVALIAVVVASGVAAKGWLWGIGYLALAVFVPTAYVLFQLARGRVHDVQLSVREERLKPYLLTVVCMVVSFAALQYAQAPRTLRQLALANAVQFSLLLLITLRWKISAHGASMGGMAAMLHALFGVGALPFWVLVPLVGWSRVHLRRHDLLQVAAGAALGMSVVWFTFSHIT